MELFLNIRLKIGKAIFAKKLARFKRKVYYSNIGQVKTIGIVWDASRTSEFSGLSRFYQKMHERHIEVRVMGYFPGKELPDKYTAIRYLTCFRKTDLNIFYHPVSSEIISFISNRFDILIDINFNKLLPLNYIAFLSNAGFKIGLSEAQNNNSPFDLMMAMSPPVDLENYLNQVIHYLEMINSEAVNTVY